MFRVLGLVWLCCAPCHLSCTMELPGDPPTFYKIAKDRRTTPEELRQFLAGPRENMPPIALTPARVEDFLAYFEGLIVR